MSKKFKILVTILVIVVGIILSTKETIIEGYVCGCGEMAIMGKIRLFDLIEENYKKRNGQLSEDVNRANENFQNAIKEYCMEVKFDKNLLDDKFNQYLVTYRNTPDSCYFLIYY